MVFGRTIAQLFDVELNVVILVSEIFKSVKTLECILRMEFKAFFLSDTFSVRSTLCFMSKEHEGVKISDQIYTSAIEMILKSHLRDSNRTSISLPFSN